MFKSAIVAELRPHDLPRPLLDLPSTWMDLFDLECELDTFVPSNQNNFERPELQSAIEDVESKPSCRMALKKTASMFKFLRP